jgi:hypothetical protein
MNFHLIRATFSTDVENMELCLQSYIHPHDMVLRHGDKNYMCLCMYVCVMCACIYVCRWVCSMCIFVYVLCMYVCSVYVVCMYVHMYVCMRVWMNECNGTAPNHPLHGCNLRGWVLSPLVRTLMGTDTECLSYRSGDAEPGQSCCRKLQWRHLASRWGWSPEFCVLPAFPAFPALRAVSCGVNSIRLMSLQASSSVVGGSWFVPQLLSMWKADARSHTPTRATGARGETHWDMLKLTYRGAALRVKGSPETST